MNDTTATHRGTPLNAESVSRDTRILIIEDDLSYVFLCKRYLRADTSHRHTIISASTVQEAMSVCSIDTFDCIVIDYCLPDSLGTEAILELQELLGDALPATIIFTADGGEEAAAAAVRSGASDFLNKRNVNQESLCRAVSNAVEKSALRQSLTRRIQELETANELLVKRNSEIQRFYHTVSHEVKTPLTAIQEFVSIVHDGLAGDVDPEQKTILKYALESCSQISSHFNDLLELSRFETGKMTVELSPNSIYSVLDHCVVAATPAAREKNISLDIDDQQELPAVMIEPNRVIQVMSNLIGNAVKFTGPGGRVSVTCALMADKNAVRISVADSGCGIRQKDLLKIFDRLYQVTPAVRTGERTGMGLGLSIASEIVRLHGSEITVESQVGEGSTFSFDLEVHQVPAVAQVA